MSSHAELKRSPRHRVIKTKISLAKHSRSKSGGISRDRFGKLRPTGQIVRVIAL